MQILPAIDLRGGRCVRLVRGDFAQETVFGEDPVAVARHWSERGVRLLHVVDLDGAREGRPVQLNLIREIAGVVAVQVGGGLRTEADIEAALGAGAQRVVLGTAALDIPFIRGLSARYGDRMVIALDTRDGRVSIRGWTEDSDWSMLDLARGLIAAGVHRFLHTDVERDGTLTAPNYDTLRDLVKLGTPVIASGGVASIDQIDLLREAGAEAAIIGRALYEGTVDLREALLRAG